MTNPFPLDPETDEDRQRAIEQDYNYEAARNIILLAGHDPLDAIDLLLETKEDVPKEYLPLCIETCLKTLQEEIEGHSDIRDPYADAVKYLCSKDYQKTAALLSLYPEGIKEDDKANFALWSCHIQIKAAQKVSKENVDLAVERLFVLFKKEKERLSETELGWMAERPKETTLAKTFRKTFLCCCHLYKENPALDTNKAKEALTALSDLAPKNSLLKVRVEKAVEHYIKTTPSRPAPKKRKALKKEYAPK